MTSEIKRDTLIFIIDMQDGMWANHGADDFDPSQFDEEFRKALERLDIRQEERRHAAIHDLVPPIHDFVSAMRPHATPVWVTMTGEGLGGLLPGMGDRHSDIKLSKTDVQSAVPQNRDSIANLKEQGYKNAIVIGIYAGDCVRNTAIDLKHSGFDVTVISDLILDDAKPGDEKALAYALHAIAKAGVSITTQSDFEIPDLVKEGKKKPGRTPGLSL